MKQKIIVYVGGPVAMVLFLTAITLALILASPGTDKAVEEVDSPTLTGTFEGTFTFDESSD